MQNNENKLKFVFFGTPDVASETLEILKRNGYLPTLIVTSPDQPQGRKMLVTPPPAKLWAIENNIPFVQPEKFTPSDFGENPDLFIVVAYGKIIPENILKIPKFGSINIHYSLLPKYRGASPVESAILNGDTVTGVTIQQMEYKLDSGPIIMQEEMDILPDENTPDLRRRLINLGAEILVKTLPHFTEGKIKSVPQDENLVSVCKKIKKEDGLVDLEAETSNVLYNKFRAYHTWPRIFFMQNGKRIIITDAILENSEFKIKKVIPEGKKEMSFEEFKRINT